MKRNLLFLSFALLGFLAKAQQVIKENFDTYANGAYLGVANPDRWKITFDDPGSAADVKVSSAKAKSGTQSMYLFSNIQGGGPQDVYMPFFEGGEVRNFGFFELSMWLYVPSQQGAYFNIHATSPIPDIKAVEVFFDNSAVIRLADNDNKTLTIHEYKQEQWNKFTVKADLTNGQWEFLLNDVPFTVQTIENNSIYALQINPQSSVNQSEFYVDDIEYSSSQTPLLANDGSLTPIDIRSRFLVGKTSAIKGQLRNVGTKTIENAVIEWSDGLTSGTETLSNLGLKSLTNKAFTLKQTYVAKPGANKVTLKIKSINNVNDDNVSNDVRSQDIKVVVPTPGKRVLAEQATGTWCQWCPRGHHLMNEMEKEYGEYFIGLAVHGSGNDPMRLNNYINFLKIEGYPSVAINRTPKIVDPFLLEDIFMEQIDKVSSATLDTKVQWAAGNKQLMITPKATFKGGAANGAYKIAIVLVEDSIQGGTAAYNQVNAYGNNQFGAMGGFEKLPTVIPFNKMTYRHVARALVNGFEGQSKTMTAIKDGDVFDLPTIKYDLPAGLRSDRLEIVTVLIGPTGIVENAIATRARSFVVKAEAVAHHEAFIGISPNPSQDLSFVNLNLGVGAGVQIRIIDINGSVIAHQDYGKLSGAQQLAIETNEMPTGVYLVQVQIDDKLLTQKMMVGR